MPLKKQSNSISRSSYKFPHKFYALQQTLAKLFYKPSPESLIDNQIIVIHHFFSPEFCDELISSFESNLKLETTPLIKSREYAARFNDRISLTSFEAADSLWKYLQDILLQKPEYEDEDIESINSIFLTARSLNPQLRIYRYSKGHHFGKHYDDSVTCPLAHDPRIQGRTNWTLLIYLTGDEEFKGGSTIFHPDLRGQETLSVHPSKGMALLHKHGDDCLKHEAELVKEGVKWVLRSDVTY